MKKNGTVTERFYAEVAPFKVVKYFESEEEMIAFAAEHGFDEKHEYGRTFLRVDRYGFEWEESRNADVMVRSKLKRLAARKDNN